MFRKPQLILILVVIGISIVLLSLPHRVNGQLKLLLGGLFVPLFGLTETTHDLGKTLKAQTASRSELLREIGRLRTENQSLTLEALQARQIRQENDLLRQAIGWQKHSPWRGVWARVISRDPSNWSRTFQINKGSNDGIIEKAPVITADGFVGKVSWVGPNRSQVIIVGNPGCEISAQSRSTGDFGIILASTENVLDPRIVKLEVQQVNTKLEPGDWIDTSGLAWFPGGIPVGKVLESRSPNYGVTTEARIQLAADIKQLHMVQVILGKAQP